MRRQLEEHEEIARPAGQRGAGQELDGERRVGRGGRRRQLTRELAARAGVVLQVMRLVEDERRPRHAQQIIDVPSEDVVVDDDPLRRRWCGCRAFDHEDGGVLRDQRDLARPVPLDGCRTDDQPRSAGREMSEGDDGLPCLAETHVVGEDGAPPPEQERDAVDLVREQPFGERHGAAERRVRIAGQPEQLCERRGLRVERVGHALGYADAGSPG
jgi:hypothetical protein